MPVSKRMVRANRYERPSTRKLSVFAYWPSKSHRQNYHRYLKSLDWHLMRMKMLRLSDFKCELCEETRNLEVHHLTYANVFEERITDLMVLCEECHAEQHS